MDRWAIAGAALVAVFAVLGVGVLHISLGAALAWHSACG